MDPERVRAYLQVACAGLGFDIGEVWWTSNENGDSTLAKIEEKNDENQRGGRIRKPRFVQLYTSKSYANRRSMLVAPPEEEKNGVLNGKNDNNDNDKHVLSPLLVDAISRTAQVVWANTKKQEGLLGRSDVRLQTAVGMPVAVDRSGNMCVVVMFSQNNIQSTDNAMEYLQSITQSATSPSIPSLLPAFDQKAGILTCLPHHKPSNQFIPLLASSSLTGVTTRFVSLENFPSHLITEPNSTPEVHDEHDLAAAPKDCFGIPMLPSFAELGGGMFIEEKDHGPSAHLSDAFDEASYGVWSTIMESVENPLTLPESRNPQESTDFNLVTDLTSTTSTIQPSSAPLHACHKTIMSAQRIERLEEFASAFLDVSVFDVADVWMPIGDQSDHLGHVTTISSTETNEPLNEFKRVSHTVLIKFWSGAVGRAFSSGNPVWSCNSDVFVDTGRMEVFSKVKIQTALAVPVFSGKSTAPACIFCCYSFVRTGSVPFVLKFVQQALRLLWEGLDNVEPHESVGKELWRDVAPADLGEMAADVEMQQHFLKKRPHNAISEIAHDEVEHSLSNDLHAMDVPSEVPSTRSIYTGTQASSPLHGPASSPPTPELGPTLPAIHVQTFHTVSSHVHDAVRSVSEAKSFPVHAHMSTTADGSKRAHIYGEFQSSQSAPTPAPPPAPQYQPQTYQPQTQYQPQMQTQPQTQPQMQTQTHPTSNGNGNASSGSPLPMPQPFPLPTQIMTQHAIPNPASTTEPSQPTQQYVSQIEQNPRVVMPGSQSDNVQTFQESRVYPPSSQPTEHNALHASYVPSPIAPVPTNQISSTGITFQQPQSTNHNVMSQDHSMNGSVSVAPNPVVMPSQSPVVMATSIPYCVATNNNNSATGVASNAKLCRIQGCNEPSAARRPYCVRHSGNRLCEHAGCSKCAQGSTRFCIAHGGGRRCTFPGCDKGARDKFFCAAHGGGKRCKFDGCNKSAVGGSQLCTAHGGGRRCSVEGCDKSAQSSTKFCVKHGGGKKCLQHGCEKVARGRTQYCAAHGGGVRCKLQGCNRVAIGKLQLCRAHGGGVRPRARNPEPTPAASNTSV